MPPARQQKRAAGLREGVPSAGSAASRDDTSADLKDRALAGYYAHIIDEGLERLGGAIIDTAIEFEPGVMIQLREPGMPRGAHLIEEVKIREHQGREYVLLVRHEGHLGGALRRDADGALIAVPQYDSGTGGLPFKLWYDLAGMPEDEWLAGARAARKSAKELIPSPDRRPAA